LGEKQSTAEKDQRPAREQKAASKYCHQTSGQRGQEDEAIRQGETRAELGKDVHQAERG